MILRECVVYVGGRILTRILYKLRTWLSECFASLRGVFPGRQINNNFNDNKTFILVQKYYIFACIFLHISQTPK